MLLQEFLHRLLMSFVSKLHYIGWHISFMRCSTSIALYSIPWDYTISHWNSRFFRIWFNSLFIFSIFSRIWICLKFLLLFIKNQWVMINLVFLFVFCFIQTLRLQFFIINRTFMQYQLIIKTSNISIAWTNSVYILENCKLILIRLFLVHHTFICAW